MKRLLPALSALACALVLSGCQGQGDAILGNLNPRVHAVNAFPNTNVDAIVSDDSGDKVMLGNQPFGSISGDIIVNNGNRVVTFKNSGTGGILATQSTLMELNHEYTAVGFGTPGNEAMVLLTDESAPAQGMAAVRVTNVTGGATVDVYVGQSGQPISAATKIFDDLANGATLLYRDTTPGDRTFFVTGANDQVIAAQQDVTLVQTHHYTLAVAANPLTTILVVPED